MNDINRNSQFSLSGKNILITGASSGIGRECALQCNASGANVILVSRREEKLKEVAAELNGDKNLIYVQDVTKYDDLEPLVSGIHAKIKKIDGFIHCAGIEITLPVLSMDHQQYEILFATNVIAGFELAKILSKNKYRNSAGSSFIFISSVMSIVGDAGLTGYCSSKGALNAGVRSLALELAPKKIRVNCISPGFVEDTEISDNIFKNFTAERINSKRSLYPLGFGKPEEVANGCIYLLSDASKWITGSNLIIDGGYSAR